MRWILLLHLPYKPLTIRAVQQEHIRCRIWQLWILKNNDISHLNLFFLSCLFSFQTNRIQKIISTSASIIHDARSCQHLYKSVGGKGHLIGNVTLVKSRKINEKDKSFSKFWRLFTDFFGHLDSRHGTWIWNCMGSWGVSSFSEKNNPSTSLKATV